MCRALGKSRAREDQNHNFFFTSPKKWSIRKWYSTGQKNTKDQESFSTKAKKIDYVFSVRARVGKNDPHLGFFLAKSPHFYILFLLRYFHEEPSEREVFFAVFKYCPCKNSLIKA